MIPRQIRSLALLLPLLVFVACQNQKMEINLKVGDEAPGFELKNQLGETVSLNQLLEESKFGALVFFRSADW